MVDLGCQDTDWIGRHDRGVLDEILLPDSLILATLSVYEAKCGYYGCIFGCFGTLRGALRITDG